MKKQTIVFLIASILISVFTGCNRNETSKTEMDVVEEETKLEEEEKNPEEDNIVDEEITDNAEKENAINIEVTSYFESYKQLVDILDMDKTESWQFGTSDSYVSDGFYLEWNGNIFSMKITDDSQTMVYGVKIGDEVEKLDEVIVQNEWVSYYLSNTQHDYLNMINGEMYLVVAYIDENGKITSWYINNWPEGEDIWEYYEYFENKEKSSTIDVVSKSSFAGVWTVDVQKTNASNDESLRYYFGSGISYGYKMELREDGTASWYIGIENGGNGTYDFSGSSGTLLYTSYEEDNNIILELNVVEENGITYIVMNFDDYKLYWVR